MHNLCISYVACIIIYLIFFYNLAYFLLKYIYLYMGISYHHFKWKTGTIYIPHQ